MASTVHQHHRLPLGEIDLNIEYSEWISNCEIDNGVMIEDNRDRGVCIDLNIDAPHSVHQTNNEEGTHIRSEHGNSLDQIIFSSPFNLNMDLFDDDNGAPTLDLNKDPPTTEMDDVNGPNEDGGTLRSIEEDIGDKKRKRNLSNDERRAIYHALLQRSVNMQLKHGATKSVSQLFSVSVRTVQRIWQIVKRNQNAEVVDVSHRMTKNCGRKRVHVDIDRIREIPLKERTTLESLSCALQISKTTIFRHLKSGVLRRHSNAIKSDLTEENKKARLSFCLSMLDQSCPPHDPAFTNMHNMIHIDEKWFYMTKRSENYYLVSDEEDPLRTCKSKNFIGKVMFLVAVARPRFDVEGNEVFSGKIGVFPLVTKEPAKRTSANRVAGTLETKPISSVGKEVMRSFLIEKVIPEIRAKWPRGDKGPIFIQQDNARTHVHPDDPQFCEAAKRDGFDIRLMCQPPNSPDLNVLDLGFFSAIQALQYKECPKTVDELVAAVVRSFEGFSSIKSNRVFLTLQLCMLEIMKVGGSNKYRIPHVKKAILEREGHLPLQFKCDATLVQDVVNQLRERA